MNESVETLYDYANGFLLGVNYRLRKGIKNRRDLCIAELISALETPVELPTLYRTTNWELLTDIYGLTRGNIKSRIGETFTNFGFTSTTINPESPHQRFSIDVGAVFVTIKSMGKHRAVDMNKILDKRSPNAHQNEILLGKNTNFVITKVAYKKGVTYIDAELKS